MKLLQLRPFVLLLLVLALFSTSCLKDDFTNIHLPVYEPTIAIPIGNAKLTISDILDRVGEVEYLQQDENGFLTIYYRSTLLSEYAGELITFDRQEHDTTLSIVFPVNLPVGDSLTISYMFAQKFSNSYDDVVDSVRFKNGDFTIELESMLDRDVLIFLSSPYVTKNDIPLRRVIPLEYNGTLPVTASVNIDLEGYSFTFDHVGNQNNLNFYLDVKVYGDNNPDPGPFDITVRLAQDNLNYRALFGLIKTRSMALLSDTINIDFFKKGLGGTFRINDPRIGINFQNSFGIPISIEVDPLKGISDINPPYLVNLTGLPAPFMLNAPDLSQVGQKVKSSIYLDKTNSNLADFLNLLPQRVEYGVEGTINPTGSVPGNFVLDTSYFEVEVEIEIPLEGYASGFTLQDTIEFSFDEDLDMLQWILFRVNAESTFPVEAAIQVTFLDSLYNPLDSLFDSYQVIIPGALPGPPPDYRSLAPAYRTYDIKATSDKLSKLNENVKYLFLTGRINTAGGGNQVVRIYTDNYLKLSVGIQSKLTLDPAEL